MLNLDEFLNRIAARPLPTNPMARIKTFAREIAEGAVNGLWPIQVHVGIAEQRATSYHVLKPRDGALQTYVERRWDGPNEHPHYNLIVSNGYMTLTESDRFNATYELTREAFALLQEAEPATIFISYKRSESSAFALLVAHTLEQAGLRPFIDMQLRPGDDWSNELEASVKRADYFILLLGPQTLDSQVTQQEIQWALAANRHFITIRHNGFDFDTCDWTRVPPVVADAIQRKHSIAVTGENPLAYNAALSELLNRFSITT